MALNGIDVSRYQGAIDWDQVKKAGISFAMLRGGYGQNNVDPYFHQNAAACQRLAIPFGIYWFSYAYTIQMRSGKRSTALPWQSSTRSPGLLLLIWNVIRSVTEPRTELPSGKPWRQI